MAASAQRLVLTPGFRSGVLARRSRRLLATSTITLFTTIILLVYLMPLAYALGETLTHPHTERFGSRAPFYPAVVKKYDYRGHEYVIYEVPIDGELRELIMLDDGRSASIFMDPARPGEKIEWQGDWRSLSLAWKFHLNWSMFATLAEQFKFGKMLVNTAIIGLAGAALTLISATLVAYGLAYFPVPGRRLLFFVLVVAIMLPTQMTQIPLYLLFKKLGWTNTLLPLIAPHFFTSATSVFLLRQIFVSLPVEAEEAALVDGAGPWRMLTSVVLPQARWGLFAVAFLHLTRSMNDYMGPYLYLSERRDLQPLALMAHHHSCGSGPDHAHLYGVRLLMTVVPLAIFLVAQRFIMRGVVESSPHNTVAGWITRRRGREEPDQA